MDDDDIIYVPGAEPVQADDDPIVVVGRSTGGNLAGRPPALEHGVFWTLLVERDGIADFGPLGLSAATVARATPCCHFVGVAQVSWALVRDEGAVECKAAADYSSSFCES